MTTTRFLATALPHSLAAEADVHLSVFFTHRLTPEAADATLADFPDTQTWVKTLQAGVLELLTDTAPDGIPVRWVSAPEAADWEAVFPQDTPVAGFTSPKVTDQPWVTYPAHAMEGHALDVHLGSAIASPLVPPPVQGNPVAQGVLDQLAALQPSVRTLQNMAAEAYPNRDRQNLARKLAEAEATLATTGRRKTYPSKPNPWTSAVEILLSDKEGEARTTKRLDGLLGTGPLESAVLTTLRDVHAARRFYQREDVPYAATPTDGATSPRPEVPVQDFHQRAASLGSTPALLRTLGLVVDLAVDDASALAALARATWVSARFTPATGADVIRLAPPRTWCESDGNGHWRAVSVGAWSGGALPLGLPQDYTVLDLDPDASGLKLEQHLRDLPRAFATELNGDPVTAAPGSLRSTGFSIARIDRDKALLAQVEQAEQLQVVDDGDRVVGANLSYDDIVRGIRLEVWDDSSREWHSVHHRRVDVVAGGRDVLTDTADVGFLQLTGLTKAPGEANPYHLHEVFVGWDGWSLSAPRPGKVIVHGDGVNGPAGEELVLDAPPDDPAGHVHIHSRIEPGTLPWLRYGRRYSFRVRGVDLAGNSVPRPPAIEPTRKIVTAARSRLDLLRAHYALQERGGLLGSLREQLIERLPSPEHEPVLRTLLESVGKEDEATWLALDAAMRDAFAETAEGEVQVPKAAVTGVKDVDRLLRSRLARRAEDTQGAVGSGLRQGVSIALGEVVRSTDTWRTRPQFDLDADDFVRLDDTRDPIRRTPRRRTIPGRGTPPSDAPDVPVVTTPRPFLRWQPVPPPTLVARKPLGVGESLQRLVIRDDQPTERHVVPPKSTQLEAEQHGMFDAAVGSTDPAAHDQLLATALKERGTLTDEFIQDLADPLGTLHQDGIHLHARPGADPAAMVTLAQITAVRDTPLGEGQYVVHDTDQLVLPYLPDVLAQGASLVFYDAGAPHTLPEPRVLQTAVLAYAGGWPSVEPLRLVLSPGDELGARRDGNTVVVTLPPGEQVRVAMSSALDLEELSVLGLWRAHPAAAPGGGPVGGAARAVLAQAAANGWFWWLTPSHDMRLVHAVRRPVHPPELAALRVLTRPPGLTVVALVGVVDVHGPSTERLTVEARWSEWVDDLTTDGPVRVDRQDVVATSPVQPDERFGLLHLVDAVLPGADGQPDVVSHKVIENFPDTHHRRVTYAARGVTRYAEFFDPSELPSPDDPSLLGAPRELTIVSSARPSAPEVTDVIPLLLWEQEAEPEQPFALRRTRRSGARIWLERPWFSSGDGELLAVVLGGVELPPSLTSRWAKDPVHVTGTPATTTQLPLVSPSDLLLGLAAGGVVDPSPARPVTLPVATSLVDAKGNPGVIVLGYQPEYHPGRELWFVDVAMDPGDSLWPFVRLAVARYQPDSLPGMDLSPVALTDWVQPLPERIATANRRTEDTVRLTVTGPISLTRLPRVRGGLEGGSGEGEGPLTAADALLRASREVFATVQEAPGPDGGDLEWVDHDRVRLPLVGLKGARATWSAELPLPEAVPMATPGSSQRFRVLVEEIEHFDADPEEGPKESGVGVASRLIYADHFPL